ncbi:MAG: hypothetical protein MAG551_00831 [Candidatus Scalindua arabica]|uniref:DUF86 domain-containing protein n=1 Tax=Candidatus Scalindua arabica TaxID=1127984 RepID=A0A941W250_9BACT|nr:hypothetical protein [Candidatus Scalindua arabica]
MSPSIVDLLKHILDEARFIYNEKSTLSEEQFMVDEKTKRAFVRSLEIIGEASKNIPIEFKERYKDVEWKEMARMRDRLIHHYFGVDYCIVWNIAEENIPILIKQIANIIKELDTK